jgi:DNA-binding MarR family transcriptional regulator
MTPNYVALAEFRYQIRRFARISEDGARAAGLEPQHHQVLLAIKGTPPGRSATVGYLAERLQLRQNSLGELLDRLAKKGLVRRRRDPADARRVVAETSPKGEAVLHRLSLFHERELKLAAPALIAAITDVIGGADRTATKRGRS